MQVDCRAASDKILHEVLRHKKKLQDYQLGHTKVFSIFSLFLSNLSFTKVFLKDDQELFLEQERDRILAKKILVLQVLLLKQYRTSSLRYSGSDSRLVLQEEVPRPTKSSGQDPELLAQLSSSQGVSGAQEGRPEDTSYDQVTNFKFVADIL